MTNMAVEMRTRSHAVRNQRLERETADFYVRFGAWQKRMRERSRETIPRIAECIKGISEREGRTRLIVRMQVSHPYLSSELGELYQDLTWIHLPKHVDPLDRVEERVFLSQGACRKLPSGARAIVQWALREGFSAQIFYSWDHRINDLIRYGKVSVLEIDRCRCKALSQGSYPYLVDEGLIIDW